MPIIFYGLKACDTCRKARKELEIAGVDYTYRDVRDDGVTSADVTRWTKALDGEAGWEKLVNKSSTTWRGLDAAEKEGLNESKAAKMLVAHPTLLKRPLIERDGDVFVGWTSETKAALLG
ncbi:MAG: Spx/MgsR family RNA polymerase-binding regulatory protein [Alphaproteobacteria bacterium]|nr:Spx/MgsR family RNA polymerase-binding regulatory protein [Alphaproteobacteria bacterium]